MPVLLLHVHVMIFIVELDTHVTYLSTYYKIVSPIQMTKTDEKTISFIAHQSPPLNQRDHMTAPPNPPTSTIASTPSQTTTHQQDHMINTTMGECPEAEGSRGEGTSSRNRRDSSRDIDVSSSDEEMRMRLEGLEVDIGKEQSAQYSSSARKSAPVSVSH